MVDPVVRVWKDGPIGHIEINRPQVLNALDKDTRAALDQAATDFDSDPDLRVVILSGAGRSFCAGADLRDWPTDPVHKIVDREYRPLFSTIMESDKFWIAQVQGSAAGIGAALALSCDFLIMADDAALYLAFAAIGLVPDGGICWHLYHAMGYRRALQAIVEGRRISAPNACETGLCNQIAPAERLGPEAEALATRIASAAPLAAIAAKRLVRRMHRMSFSDALSAEAFAQTPLMASEDAIEGLTALRERRSPRFRGR